MIELTPPPYGKQATADAIRAMMDIIAAEPNEHQSYQVEQHAMMIETLFDASLQKLPSGADLVAIRRAAKLIPISQQLFRHGNNEAAANALRTALDLWQRAWALEG